MKSAIMHWLMASAQDASKLGWESEEEMYWKTFHYIEELENEINKKQRMETCGKERNGAHCGDKVCAHPLR